MFLRLCRQLPKLIFDPLGLVSGAGALAYISTPSPVDSGCGAWRMPAIARASKWLGKAGAAIAGRACKIVLAVGLKARGELSCGIIGGAAGGYAGGSFLAIPVPF